MRLELLGPCHLGRKRQATVSVSCAVLDFPHFEVVRTSVPHGSIGS